MCLQFTLVHAASCVLHRSTSQVIHRLELCIWPLTSTARAFGYLVIALVKVGSGDHFDAMQASSMVPLRLQTAGNRLYPAWLVAGRRGSVLPCGRTQVVL